MEESHPEESNREALGGPPTEARTEALPEARPGTRRASPDEARLVFLTHPKEGARAFARGLVEAHLAACVSLVQTNSVYRWEGAVEEAAEELLLIKSSASRLPALEAHVARAHPYDCPELLSVAPREVESGYLNWLLSACDPPGDSDGE